MLSPESLRTHCLDFPGSSEEFPFSEGVSVFKVGGKMFALSALRREPLDVSVKCEPELAEDLRAANPAIRPGYHLDKRHWITIAVNGLPDQTVKDLIEDSYDLVVAKLPHTRRPPAG
ncbi:MAG: MmcQ/YjbR family DNA-binding protein [Thermoleophilaceae bacterium]